MNIEILLLLFVLILAIIYAGTCRNNGTSRIVAICVCLAIIVLFVVIKIRQNMDNNVAWYEGFQTANNVGYAPLSYNMGKCSGYDISGKPPIYPVYRNYDGLILKSAPAVNAPLSSEVTIFSPVGDGIKLTEDPVAYSFNTVDGQKNSPRHLFMLAHNQSSFDCCPSTYSTDKGCVCLTDKQREMINGRGGNRTNNGYPSM